MAEVPQSRGLRGTLAARVRRWLEIDRIESEVDRLSPEVENLGHAMFASFRWSNLAYSITALRAVVGTHSFDDPPLISVITATHNRRGLLERAVASVQAQRYPNWEHVIVVDRCEDDTLDYVTSLATTDSRVRFLVTDHGRCSRARNDAYSHASGALVVYLDDDNQFDDLWLASAAWAFESYPTLDALYGVLVVDHHDRLNQSDAPGTLPDMFLHPFDRQALTRDNYVDIGAFAHRAGLAEAHFDGDLGIMEDWEMFGRVASVTTPLALPALSVVYRTAGADRQSLSFPGNTVADDIRERLRAILLDGSYSDPS